MFANYLFVDIKSKGAQCNKFKKKLFQMKIGDF